MSWKECILEDKECVYCGECDICDLDNSKICDSCGKCIDDEADFKSIGIDDILETDE